MKRIAKVGGAALVSGVLLVLFQTSYAAREAMVVLGALSIVYCAVLLFWAFGFLAFRGAVGISSWGRAAPQWNGAPGKLALTFNRPEPTNRQASRHSPLTHIHRGVDRASGRGA